MAIFTGAGVAIITPFSESLQVNYTKLRELIDEQINNGTDAIIICGTTGEASTLTHEEHIEVIRACVEYVAGRVPVVAGTGSNCTETAIYLSRAAEAAGADGLLVVTPYYNKASQKGLKKHFTAVAESVNLPIIMYNVPSRTGCNLQPKTVADLVHNVPNIVGIKEASGNISQVAEIMALCGDEIDLYSGNDDQIVPLLSLGGKGVISVLSNVKPQETHDIVDKYLSGDIEGSRRLQLENLDLIGALFCDVNPIPVKVAMNLMGKNVGGFRGPLCDMEPVNQKRLEDAMTAAGIQIV
ncbi:MAG: 4-hydroxy-tetrahydrodipicolinate synthase [Lachnospiraceae bacterium]